MAEQIEIFDPTAKSKDHLDGVLPGWDDLRDLRVAAIDNTKPKFDVLVEHIGGWLHEEQGTQPLHRLVKRAPTLAATAEQYAELANYELVLAGSAD